MLDGVRLVVALAATALLTAVVAALLGLRAARPAALVEAFGRAPVVLLGLSYAALLVSGVGLLADLAGKDAPLRWYGAPLVSVAVLAGLAGVALIVRAERGGTTPRRRDAGPGSRPSSERRGLPGRG